ncbi:Homeodomain-like protein [Annulohypoxylon truncatum]|uniref:Homeodomain-like protein n=1 Tax=Annulohypoxylon truncatum TaxID=327061 RepID=UPI002007B72E|nr:Homeodomain-like protein [Annulohypoxylon truncatum]KAI1205995.1 Homeodomain-like protein [Annulohypoxylon truncatum]
MKGLPMESQPEQKHQRRGPWSQREDELLKHYVAVQGPLCWVRISAQIGTRSSKQCRERYHQNLKPSLNHNPISTEEGAQIEEMVSKIGKRWAEIARSLDNRSDNAVKNWWNGSMNRRRRLLRRQNSTIQETLSPNQSQSSYYSQGAPQLPLPQHQLQLQLQHHQAAAEPSPLAAAQENRPPLVVSPYPLPTLSNSAYPKSHGQTSPYNYSSHHSSRHYSHHPLDASNQQSYQPSHQTTGSRASFSEGLPSPSLTSPSVEPQDPPPGLASSSNSKIGAARLSSMSREHPPRLPPLRIGNGELPGSQLSSLTTRVSQLQFDYSNVRLPPIRDCSGSSQLPTAPSSPQVRSPGPEPKETAQSPTHEDEKGNSPSRRKVSIHDLLS